MENNALSLALKVCGVAASCRNKVAEQLLEIGAKAGIVGLAGAALKDVADKITSDELDHLIMLQMMGTNEITEKYLNSLQDKYAPDAASNPNIGKDLTDEQKKELGGTGSGTPGGWGPEDEQSARDKELSTSDKRSIKSLEEQIRAHEEKLAAYKHNPDAFDNQCHLQNAPSDAVRQRIIEGRIRHLENEIKTLNKNINEIKMVRVKYACGS
ncbi:hypothetical protein [Pectobacterium odoriferum]|uniref:hypothetical protein n=1 Tax=Pectobacterium odoriferum TaxID=78398 RepID=UPI001FCB6E9E|nr:hypothetical protein [Pectobacterium odoriferum]